VRLPALADARHEGFLAGPAAGPEVAVGPDDPACVGFTSGSTGAPKGIVGRHGPLTHFLPWLAETFELGPDDRFSLLSGLAHDPLQRDLFTPLCLGATICVPAAEDFDHGAALAAWAAREQVSVAHLTPALGQLLAQAGDLVAEATRIDTLRWAFFVGDVLLVRDVARLRKVAPRFTCVSYYGTTETQRAVGCFVVPPAEQHGAARALQVVPAGRGIRHVQLLVLNAAGGLCGIGELGEIHVRSPHLAAGYLGAPELTAEKFLVNPWTGVATDRLYRSGDAGRYLPDGNVSFAGRRDLQVKIRGFRIELPEIEAVIAERAEVRDTVVVAREDRPGDRRLVAYVVANNGDLSPAALREHVGARLPGYMVPAHVVVLDALPVTPNGKVDRRALPAPRDVARASGFHGTPPRTPLESEVAAIWQELLGLDAVDVHQTFFAAGGHSLLSTALLARLRSWFAAEVTLARFFDRPTVAGLAEAVDEARRAGTAARPPIGPAPRSEFRVALGREARPVVSPSLKDKLMTLMRGANGR